MEQNKVEILEVLNNEKMYSLRGDEVGEMCSPEGDDTCGDGCLTFQGRNRLEEGAGGVLSGGYGYVRVPEGRYL